jgi:hypothetical protein
MGNYKPVELYTNRERFRLLTSGAAVRSASLSGTYRQLTSVTLHRSLMYNVRLATAFNIYCSVIAKKTGTWSIRMSALHSATRILNRAYKFWTAIIHFRLSEHLPDTPSRHPVRETLLYTTGRTKLAVGVNIYMGCLRNVWNDTPHGKHKRRWDCNIDR